MSAGDIEVHDLSGTWRAAEADGALERTFAERELDDSSWATITVPGHWRSSEHFAASDGPVLYRRRLSIDPPAAGRRRFLQFDGIFYDGDVWLDGAYVGDTQGYFECHTFDVTDRMRDGSQHTLAVEVACAPQSDRTAKRLVTGVFSHWDNLDPTWNPGGIWRPVRLLDTGPVRLARTAVLCTEATVERGRLLLDLDLDAGEEVGTERQVRLTAHVHGSGVEEHATRDATVVAGSNRIPWTVQVESPPLWWPKRLGDQPLVDVDIAVEIDGAVSDTRSRRTAFREISVENWTFTVNGRRIFVMGSNQGPTRMQIGETHDDEFRHDIELAQEANLDLLRVHAHVTLPGFYDAADEAGLLVWQDFPLQWGYARGLRREATRQARAMVEQLGHHPSIALWCAHNEPLAVDANPGEAIDAVTGVRILGSMALPTWNKDVLDRSVARALHRADSSRFVDRHSGIVPGPTSGGTDTHWYFGWYHGEMGQLARMLTAWPRTARFISEYGAQAVPADASFMEPARWPDLDWDRLFERHALQKRNFDRYVPPDDYATFDDWRDATQEYQAALIQLQTEDIRRIRHRPAGGFCHFCFADGHPSVTWSVLDHARRPKKGYGALRDACRPLLPVLDPRTGAVHVVHEGDEPLVGAVVEARVGRSHRRWQGDIASDDVTFVGRIAIDDAGRSEEAEISVSHSRCGEVVNTYSPLLLRSTRPGAALPS